MTEQAKNKSRAAEGGSLARYAKDAKNTTGDSSRSARFRKKQALAKPPRAPRGGNGRLGDWATWRLSISGAGRLGPIRPGFRHSNFWLCEQLACASLGVPGTQRWRWVTLARCCAYRPGVTGVAQRAARRRRAAISGATGLTWKPPIPWRIVGTGESSMCQ